ncbi:hypothetical protein [Actinomyces oris]|nr:hypothetical protein [Actinomyces oris]
MTETPAADVVAAGFGAEEPQPDSGSETRSAATRARAARLAAEPVR